MNAGETEEGVRKTVSVSVIVSGWRGGRVLCAYPLPSELRFLLQAQRAAQVSAVDFVSIGSGCCV